MPAKLVASRSVRPSLRLEKSLLRNGLARLAGMDEVGRGALAGPVTVGVVLIDAQVGRVPMGLRDSKLLTAAERAAMAPRVRRWAVESAVGHASAAEIDRVGIMSALRLAAGRAMGQLSGPVHMLILDGNHNYLAGVVDCPVHLRIKADLTCAAVAGASVLAKTARDGVLSDLDRHFPAYHFGEHKGYAAPSHRAALLEHGPSVVHRRSWSFIGNDGGSGPPLPFDEDDDDLRTAALAGR